MKPNHNKLWIIILGGVIGLTLGLGVSYFAVSNRWEKLSYPALAPDKERAIALSGYDSHDGTLYVKGQSQTIYGCPAEPYRENSDCHRVALEIAFGLGSCPGPQTQRIDDPPGKVISKMIIFDCRYNGYTTFQTNYVILDDSSLLKWTYNNLGEVVGRCFIIPSAIFGMVLGLVIGAMVAATRNQPRSSA